MTIRITDLNEIMQGQHQGSGYISIGNEQFPNLVIIYFGMTGKPNRAQAEKVAQQIINGVSLSEVCA